jgi:arylsulfatase A-like enzyme
VFILADDMGWGDPQFMGGKIPTPHIDSLAAAGMHFTDAHTTSAVCTPTRYSIVTGRYNWRTRLQSGVLWGPSPPLIDSGEPTVAGWLQREGYASTVIGKWHLGLGWARLDQARTATSGPTKGDGWDLDYTQRVGGGPTDLGFSEDFLYPASLDMPPYVYLRNDLPTDVPTVTKSFKVPARPGPATADFEAENCLDDFAREATQFIARQAASETPFFLYLPLTSPHTPILPTEPWRGKSGLGEYGDFVMQTDWVVGQVLQQLQSSGVAEDTFVVFTSDNGCSPQADIPNLVAQGHYPVGHWRGHKADIFEGGHRVPFVVRWPGVVEPGSVSNQTICTMDFFATVADVLGEWEAPSRATGGDSYSFLPLLVDPQRDQPTRPHLIHHSINGSFAIRRGPWKLCLCPDSGGWSNPRPGREPKGGEPLPAVQLYNLESDPGETTNVADQHAALVEELTSLVETEKAKTETSK